VCVCVCVCVSSNIVKILVIYFTHILLRNTVRMFNNSGGYSASLFAYLLRILLQFICNITSIYWTLFKFL
jgi:hypothetical protein